MASRPSPAAASSLDQKLEESTHEVDRKLGPSGHYVFQEHIANTKSYPMTSSTDAMEHNPPSNSPSRPAYPLLLPSLLDSSHMLSSGEEQTIRDTIHDISTTLTSVDGEIARVRATLSTLEEYRSTLQTTLAQHQGALSPIRKLPPEILGEIFLFVSSDETLEWPGISGLSWDMPWVMSKICRYWRMVAISTSKLWSNIGLNLMNSACLEGQQHFLNLCLSRSKNELLTISLHAEAKTLLPISDILVSHSERWQNLSLNIDQLSDLRDALPLAKNRVPNLRRLHIERRQIEWEAISLSPFEAFEYAENLHELALTNIDHLRNFRIPWSQITHLTTKDCNFSYGEFVQAMRHMSNLIAFSTNCDCIFDDASTQPALLPHLRKLSITNERTYLSTTCRFLTVPALEELSVSFVSTFLEEEIVAMIERSGCQPKRLTLRSSLKVDLTAGIENCCVVQVLSALPSLTHLDLTIARADLFVLQALADYKPSTERAPLLPGLNSLVLEDRFCTSAFDIANALSLCVMNDVRPGSLSISLRLLPPQLLDSLKGLAENHGLEITILSD